MLLARRYWLATMAAAITSCGGQQSPSSPSTAPTFSILVFSKTAGFRHDSIPAGIAAIRQQGSQRGFSAESSEDGSAFTDASLSRHKVVVFLSTTGDVLDSAQQEAFERFVRAGGGFIGIHSAADTEYDWPFYGRLIGAYFAGHPDIQQATVRIESTSHPSTAGLPNPWVRRDEWYNFRDNPRASVTVLATLDEGTYSGGTMGADHPIAWAHANEGGRAWYTAGGHTQESFSETLFADHIGAAIVWASGN
jgi:cytochrome c